jgi:type IV pilus assembly protein PilW
VNLQVALSLIDDAGREAGTGLFSNGQPLCQKFNAWRGGVKLSDGAALMPARISSAGQATASDRLIFTTSNATGPLSAMPVLAPMATVDASIVVSDSGVLSQGDLALVGVPGSATVPCTLFQVTATPVSGTSCSSNASQCKTLQRASSSSYNAPVGTFTTESLYGFATAGSVTGPAAVQRLGTGFRQDAFAIMCNTLIRFNNFTDTPACTSTPLAMSGGANALASDIVLLKAQYGVSATPSSDVVTDWVAATGSWANPIASDVARIKAVRVVIVGRSKVRASELVTAVSCTNANGVVNTGPCSFDDAQAPVLDLSNVAVPTGLSWRNYRYRVQQAVIPLRNVLWGN